MAHFGILVATAISATSPVNVGPFWRLFMLSKKIALFFPLFMLVAGLLVSSPVLAQSTATLQGTVTDAKGAVIPNATVTVRNKATSTERTVQTDSDGNYQLAALPVGNYSVEFKVQGF